MLGGCTLQTWDEMNGTWGAAKWSFHFDLLKSDEREGESAQPFGSVRCAERRVFFGIISGKWKSRDRYQLLAQELKERQ